MEKICYNNIFIICTVKWGCKVTGRKFIDLSDKLNCPNREILKLQNENMQLKEEVKKLNKKITIINDYYQLKIDEINEESKKDIINKLKQENIDLKQFLNNKKITNKQIQFVRKLRSLGYSYKKISIETSISTTTISRILNGEYD